MKNKRIFSLLGSFIMIISILSVFPAMTAGAAVFGDFEYKLNGDKTVSITKYKGSSKKVTIPDKINNNPVLTIEGYAFSGNKKITSVVVSNNVQAIGEGAFFNCESLKTLTLSSKSNLIYIASGAFRNCKSLTNISLPSSLVAIYDYAFYGSGLKAVKIPNKVTYVGQLAFGNCPGITGVSIPKALDDIGSLAFGYVYNYFDEDSNIMYFDPIKNFKINCYADTAGEKYALSNDFNYCYSDASFKVTDFKAAAVSQNAVKLTWKKVKNANGYIVYRYNSSTKKWVRIAKGKNLSYTDKNLKPGTSYKYAVRAYANVNGNEILSASYPQITAVTKPENVSGFKAAATSTSAIKLTWNKTSGAEGYVVYRYNTASKRWIRIAKGGNLAFTDKNLKSATLYKYAIRAYKTVSGKEILSPEYPILSAATNPLNVTGFKAASSSYDSIKLAWDKVSGADGYVVYRYNTETNKWVRIAKGKNLSFTDKNREPGTSYEYAVRAYKIVNGKELLSKSYPQISAITTPSNVTGFKADEVTVNSVTLVWEKTDGADGYVVYRYNTEINKWVRIAKGANLSFTDKNLQISTEYKYAIRAYKTDNGKEILSPSYPQITVSTDLADVGEFEADTTSVDSVSLVWSKVDDADGYVVYRYNEQAQKYNRIAKENNLMFTDIDREPGKTYKYAIRAYKMADGKEVLSKSYPQVITSTIPEEVDFTLTIQESQAVLAWTQTQGADGYYVYYKTNIEEEWINLLTTEDTSCSAELGSGEYYFTVIAYREVDGKIYIGEGKEELIIIE